MHPVLNAQESKELISLRRARKLYEVEVWIPVKVKADSEGIANSIPGRRRTEFGAKRRWQFDCARGVRLRQAGPIRDRSGA